MTPEIFEAICDRIENTSINLINLCKEQGVSTATFYEFKKTSEEHEKRYARAKEIQCDFIAEEIMEIADDATNDFMTVVKGDIEYEKENKEVVNRSRLRVDSRKWLLSKLMPKKYGEHTNIEHSGGLQVTRVELPQKAEIGAPVEL